MQKSLYSSSPSPTAVTLSQSPPPPPPLLPKSSLQQSSYAPRTASDCTATRATPAIIPLDYRTMSPSNSHSLQQYGSSQMSSTALELDNPYSSLFGDPVPPPTQPDDYFGNAFETLHGSASVELPSSEEDTFGAAVKLVGSGRRLFSNVPYISALTGARTRNFDVLPSAIPRLQPPDIQILPNSSGGSSSEQHDSPNFTLLAPQDIITKPSLYELGGSEDVSRLSESYTICDANGKCEYQESEITRGPSVLSDIKPPTTQASMKRQCSNESYSSTEWFRPAAQRYPEFSRIPKLRPSSKNIMGMKREDMPPSPLAPILQDSNGSSSGSGAEERLRDPARVFGESTVSPDTVAPARPPAPSVDIIREMTTNLILSPREYLMRRDSSFETPPPPPPAPASMTPPNTSQDLADFDELEEGTTCSSLRRGISPVILKDSIATGGDYRVEQARLHKKTSFTIISDKSPTSSRAHSPSSQRRTPTKQPPAQSTTTSSSTAKPMAKTRYHLQRKSLTSTHIKLPRLSAQTQQQFQLQQQHTIDDSPRPSVQFNMSGRYSPSKVIPQKSILQQRDSLTSSQDTYTPTASRRPSTTATNTLPQIALSYDGQKFKSCETLPLITDPYRSAIPRLHRSSHDVRRESAAIPPGALPRPLKPNPNPTRKQRGLLRILNHEDSLSRIPLRSNWTSMDDLSMVQERRPSLDSYRFNARRRSSSTSPERRSSTVTASDRRSSNLSTVTTSDFSFRRPSQSGEPPMHTQRRKSLYPTTSPVAARRQSTYAPTPVRTKISKPTTLSPIIGTPNKDSSTPGQSPVHGASPSGMINSDTPSDLTSRRDSYSRIPIANNLADSRLSSSQSPSRMSSPLKEFTATLPLSGRTSRATSSRSPSRATGRSTSDPTANQQGSSRANSRAAESRTSSRASTRPISREAHSRTASRPSTRGDSRSAQRNDVANSRANSRLSIRSSQRSGTSISPALSRSGRATTPNRRKSISLSPPGKRTPTTRKKSISPVGKQTGKTATRRGRSPKATPQRRGTKSSRIPTRSESDARSPPAKSASRSPPKSKMPASAAAGKSSSPKAKSAAEKPATVAGSAKKTPTAARRAISSVKQTPATKRKQQAPATTTKKVATAGKSAATPQQQQHAQQSGGRKTPVKGAPVPANPAANGGKGLTRGASQQSLRKAAGTPTEAGKKPGTAKDKVNMGLEKKEGIPPLAEQLGNAVLHAAEAVPAVTSEVAVATPTGSTIALRRQGSNMSTLVRMSSRLSLMGKKRTDSAQSRKVPTVPEVPVETANGDSVPPSPLTKLNSAGQILAGDAAAGSLPAAAILEKSQKTLESIQKTVTEATDEIQKTINENLTDLKTFESDMGLTSDSVTSPTPSMATVVAKPGESASRSGTADGSTALLANAEVKQQKSPAPPTQPIEAAVSVLNASSAEAAERNYELDVGGGGGGGGATTTTAATTNETTAAAPAMTTTTTMASGAEKPSSGDADFKVDAKRRSPDGQGGSTSGSGGKTGSQEYLEPKDNYDSDGGSNKGCSRCCSKLCMPCRRARCSRCCQRGSDKLKDESDEQPVLSATSSATTATNLEIIDEKDPKASKPSCWQRLNCCKSCGRKKQMMEPIPEPPASAKMETIHESTSPALPTTTSRGPSAAPQGACGLCWSRVFCCRSVNKVDPKTGDETQLKKCCFCIPCRRKRGTAVGAQPTDTGAAAWQDPERGISATDASVLEGSTDAEAIAMQKQGCCQRFWRRVLCCRKQPPRVTDARRQSIRAPPPSEDTRRKLHVDLVEYTSQMKGAIPVLPLFLAWFCAICNIVFPGLGTLLSGFFCICVGIPRFSQYDSARARIGSFIINIIVAVAQFFCVLFCFVGWGWSIWWGVIMLRCAKKLSKIKKVEKLEMEEEERQAEAAAAAAATAAATAAAIKHAPQPHVEVASTKT